MQKNQEVPTEVSEARKLATNKPESQGDAVLRIIQKNVSSSDLNVRRYATAALSRVMFATRMAKDMRKQYGVNVTYEAVIALLPSVIPLLSDVDAEVRTNVMRTIVLSCHRTDAIEKVITSRYDREPTARIRAMIISYLAMTKTRDARLFVAKGLKDNDALVRGWSADALRHLHPVPKEFFSHMLDTYAREHEHFVKQKYMNALAAHGKEVAEHLPKLEILLQSENHNQHRAGIARAIYFAESGKSAKTYPHSV